MPKNKTGEFTKYIWGAGGGDINNNSTLFMGVGLYNEGLDF